LNLVERWFREMIDEAQRRGVAHIVPDLIASIEKDMGVLNDNPRPFVWTASAESLLTKVRRGDVALDQTVINDETVYMLGVERASGAVGERGVTTAPLARGLEVSAR